MKINIIYSIAVAIIVILSRTGDTKAETPQTEWELVRTVTNPYGGTMDYVLIPEQKQRDVAYYKQIVKKLHGAKEEYAMVFFWVDKSNIPKTAAMHVSDMRKMTAECEKKRNQAEADVRLASWLYTTPEEAKEAHCFYAP